MRTTMRQVIIETAREFNVSPLDIRGTKKARGISWPRIAARSLCRDIGKTYPQIANEFMCDHTSVMYSVSRAADLREISPDFCERYDILKAALTPLPVFMRHNPAASEAKQ